MRTGRLCVTRMLNAVERQFGSGDVTSGFCMPDALEQQVRRSLRSGCHRSPHPTQAAGAVQSSTAGGGLKRTLCLYVFVSSKPGVSKLF
jgi:hypothetical protein